MQTADSPLEQAVLWNSWFNSKDDETANALISNYMYLVNYHVERFSSQLPKSVSKDDIKSLGLLGLYDALHKFEPDRDLKFDTYASIRIRGAIIDGLRKEDWLPRSLRDKIKKVERTQQELEQQLKREPSTEEIAKKVGISEEEVESILKDSLAANVLSIEEKPKHGDKGMKEGIGYLLPADSSEIPEKKVIHHELIRELAEGIKMLNKNEQLVISLFYFDELTLTEIGQVLGLTTSRISQIHKRSIEKLRNILEKVQQLS
ncbi:MAG TPA: FliA/WhiG family RNA polymerase sigma factor [Bacillota bacterium]|jgi:RNA polymerase sigma factor for flagellar operon FliA|nr:FliA/WhiG family RNA polymerase sigma factor [Compostibacillus humi]HLT55514.1 FliA/WhiG family RNA polymerase sigma factor [Bacillota bacterium]